MPRGDCFSFAVNKTVLVTRKTIAYSHWKQEITVYKDLWILFLHKCINSPLVAVWSKFYDGFMHFILIQNPNTYALLL